MGGVLANITRGSRAPFAAYRAPRGTAWGWSCAKGTSSSLESSSDDESYLADAYPHIRRLELLGPQDVAREVVLHVDVHLCSDW